MDSILASVSGRATVAPKLHKLPRELREYYEDLPFTYWSSPMFLFAQYWKPNRSNDCRPWLNREGIWLFEGSGVWDDAIRINSWEYPEHYRLPETQQDAPWKHHRVKEPWE